MREALGRYSDEVSRFKATGKKEMQRIRYFQDNLPNTDWPLSCYKGEFLKQWEDAVSKRTIKPLKPSTILRDYSTLSSFFNWCRKDKGWIESNPVENLRKPKNLRIAKDVQRLKNFSACLLHSNINLEQCQLLKCKK